MRTKIPIRSHEGVIATTNKANKKELMKDFNCRCGYCNDHHRYVGGTVFYHLDHFAPKSKFPEYKWNYENMVYSCPYCNISKSSKWVTDSIKASFSDGKGFIDPCLEEYTEHFVRHQNGLIEGKTDLGKYMVKELRLSLALHQYNHLIDSISRKVDELEQYRDSVEFDTTILLDAFYLMQNIQRKRDDIFTSPNMF